MRFRHPLSSKRKIVAVIGGGFGGLNVAKSLVDREEIQVLLIDRSNHHLFQPLLYQVATAGLNPSDIAVPIRTEFRGVENVEVYLAKVDAVNLVDKYIIAQDIELEFDYLVMACGAQHNYFSHPEWQTYAPGLKTLEQATEIRRRILIAFEKAENELDPEVQKALLTFVVIGGGPTGVELAGAIAEISRTVLVKDFKRINPADACVILVESGPRVLSGFNEKASAQAIKDLRHLGVTVYTSSVATNITETGVQVGDTYIPSRTALWAAGVQARTIDSTPALTKDRAGRITVTENYSIPQYPFAFVIGDMAAFEVGKGTFLPGLAPVAIQGGQYVAKVILGAIHGRHSDRFIYDDKGMMATIGKNRAIAQFRSLTVKGRLAWWMWLVVHLLYLVGVKNRIAVISQWIWSYLLSKRGARLIIEKEWKMK